ncbi:conserved hypothetical protein [Aspergillus udagawae]|uniref:Uncharacterized protein n=1 Tax=Aspergillus udagawae TaxID=91492 RepID=A0A8H3N3U1_9EURO|nr:uncharacterized protein Aud_005193 [Aspergillus udagawae]GFF24515.1 conserved hypothetical protein [Aspergillus udagawae]GFF56272.1 conserved hypothetical protein [Aspergillus udagawae]GFF89318.1 conserved hypothetical protein [Aspergillus udagawae]GFG15302.1 conserved hypothetical protein [Aspergillus udagawae]GFG25419.1 conserved hypothetical protein [Aspergillus udagawae]
MPVIPSDTSNFPTAQGSNNPEDNSSKGPEHEQKKATAFDHISKGPQIPDSMPPKASREEIEQRKKELNQ